MKVKELLSDRSKWCQGSFATDAEGNPRGIMAPDATRFCLRGALGRCYPEQTEYDAARKRLESSLSSHSCLMEFNDSTFTTFTDVKELLERADV